MVFSSITFIVFFCIVACVMAITKLGFLRRKFEDHILRKFRHLFLLAASYVFYGWWDWRFCFLMFALTVVAYISAKRIDEKKCVKLFKFIGIVVPLVILGIFKYFNFFVDSFCDLFGIEGYTTLNIILPVGISFYTFQSMSYTIDVIRKHIPRAGFIEVALYIAFFPQLVAGPIVKAQEFIPQLKEDRNINLKNLEVGLQIFLMGLFKKIVIADQLSVFVDQVFEKPVAFHSITVILAVVAYSIQIYFDFSGYSDMAIGSAKCLGYDFNRNFNIPYISKNVSEFWKRWHISLSTWLQEYLYIPLGGNRKGKARTYINLLATMVIGGLWHGASWNFVLWGALHGTALCIHKLFKAMRENSKYSRIGGLISILATYIFVCVCWVPFRSTDISTTFEIIKRMFVWHNGIVHIYFWVVIAIAVVLLGTLVAAIKAKKHEERVVTGFYPIFNLEKFGSLVLLFVFMGIILIFAYTNSNPFIYFQF